MKILKYPSHEIIWVSQFSDHWRIADAARTCYKSEGKGKDDDSRLISACFKNGHHSVLEHSSVTIRFICDRGVSHELVRHRLASFSQESTRYCNYSKGKFGGEITVIKPVGLKEDSMEYFIWEDACRKAETSYLALIEAGVKPETARSVLPTSLKTEVVMTANLRELYHIIDIRDTREAQPDMRYMMHGLLVDIWDDYPELFHDLFRERNEMFLNDFVRNQKKGNE